MSVEIKIFGVDANEAIKELKAFANGLPAPVLDAAKIADAKQGTDAKSEPNDMPESDGSGNADISKAEADPNAAPKRRGRPKKDASAAETPAQPEATSESAEPAGTESTSDADEDDEFAAFTAAAAKTEAAPVEVPARKWTDADMGALTNQAAQKTGDPAPIKALIAEFTPEGEVPHSRNIPAERREDFAKALQAKVGFEFAG